MWRRWLVRWYKKNHDAEYHKGGGTLYQNPARHLLLDGLDIVLHGLLGLVDGVVQRERLVHGRHHHLAEGHYGILLHF